MRVRRFGDRAVAFTIVGRWEVVRTCEGMIEALEQAGLRNRAPSVVGDYFPEKSPKQLARKADVCQGAKPQQHAHYRYRIVGGNKLTLEPVIPARSKRKALANPLEFGPAAHSAAVAYTGHTWKRVACAGWC